MHNVAIEFPPLFPPIPDIHVGKSHVADAPIDGQVHTSWELPGPHHYKRSARVDSDTAMKNNHLVYTYSHIGAYVCMGMDWFLMSG